MNDHPDLQDLPTMPPLPIDRFIRALTYAIQWGIFLTLMVLMPVIVWLWRWAL